MGDIGVPELVIILIIVVICFGPSRLAGVGKSLGDGIRSFRESVRDPAPADAVAGTASSTLSPTNAPTATTIPMRVEPPAPPVVHVD